MRLNDMMSELLSHQKMDENPEVMLYINDYPVKVTGTRYDHGPNTMTLLIEDLPIEEPSIYEIDDNELPGMWEKADYTGGKDYEVRESEPVTDLGNLFGD